MKTKYMTPTEILQVDAKTVRAGDNYTLKIKRETGKKSLKVYEVPAHWQLKEKPQRTLRNNPNN